MGFLRNIKIGAKLSLGFSIVCIFVIVVGIAAIININKIQSNAQFLYDSYLIGSTRAGKMESTVNEIRANFNILTNYVNINNRATYYDSLMKTCNQMEELFKSYQETIYGVEEDQLLFDDVKKYYDSYHTAVVNAADAAMKIQFVEEYASGEFVELNNLVPQARQDLLDSIDKVLTANQVASKKAIDDMNVVKDINLAILISLILFALIVSVIFAASITKTTTGAIGKLITFARHLENGDLTSTINIDTKDEIATLADVFTKSNKNLREILGSIVVSADEVDSGSRQVSAASSNLAEGTQTQASAIEQITASIMDIESQTKQNAKNANDAMEISREAKSNAEVGDKEMKEMLVAMKEINDSSNNISKVIKVIDEIAFQTNILALNAAVEAARAGQHGKGFAVVAEEVRNLATRSANAVKETTTMIEGSIGKVNIGTELANHTADALHAIVDSINKSSEIVEQIATSSGQQANAISEVTTAIEQVSKVIQTNSATSEEASASSQELSEQASNLKHLVSTFKI